MNLDLNELIGDWTCPKGETAARVVGGKDGLDYVQLRVDLGVLQMAVAGRPDGQRYRGLPSVREYIAHELRLGHLPDEQDWNELQRELTQLNYRRIAWGQLAEVESTRDDNAAEREHLKRALGDIDESVQVLRTMEEHTGEAASNAALLPTLHFNRARFASRIAVLEERFEDAIEAAETGANALNTALEPIGLDESQRERDPGIAYLRQLGRRLRRQYDIDLTVREQLDEAIEREDFERAAQLREEIRRRKRPTTYPSAQNAEDD